MILNIVGLNIIWFGLVLLGDSFIPLALIALYFHITIISKVKNEIWLIVCISVVGIICDSLLQFFQLFIFESNHHLPFWLMTLWPCFAATICHSLKVLTLSKLYQMLVGALFAPLSYLAGYKLNVIDFGQSLLVTYIVLSVVWAGLFLLFFYLKANFTQEEGCHV
ncbi:DUF2878 domain-containing protein [Thalassotalea profundi]|uniref:Membrane protein n=1 Tax=Thalassotalea profundi TaxID=2036687 RepID=A0ABQ3IHD6_9GAMM|nr:DUF2878 domain-containing protein [Thalassotalea profundi]GHE81432.1 membrane protein [Thalassotalea profundi]